MFQVCYLLFPCVFLHLASSSRILAALPTVSQSHFDFFEPLLLELASRGHQVTVVSNFPRKLSVKNYMDIDLSEYHISVKNSLPIQMMSHVPIRMVDNLFFLSSRIAEYEKVFSHGDVKRLLASNETFDLVITELFNTDIFLGFGYKFDAPTVSLSSCYLMPWGNARFGSPDSPSYIPVIFHDNVSPLNFRQRVYNTYQLVVARLAFYFLFNPESERIAKRFFGKSLPPLSELAKNSSLLIVNTHHTLHGPRPFSPQVIEVGGIHVKQLRPLPEELDEWMNSSTHGVVYFSFGSMLRGATLPTDKVRSFLTVFASLRQRVLWKWEDDSVAGLGLPDNVRVMKWIPQRDVLAHPKTKVFISHGGLLGTTEAVVSGVPVLGIPMYGDQPNNVAAMVEKGVAIHVDYNNISETSLSYALNALIADKRYAENARELSKRFQDRPQSALETAVFWTEYVIRHKGAPHLQSAAVHMPWYQLWLLDVTAVCLVALVSTAAFVFFTLRSCLRLLLSASAAKLKTS